MALKVANELPTGFFGTNKTDWLESDQAINQRLSVLRTSLVNANAKGGQNKKLEATFAAERAEWRRQKDELTAELQNSRDTMCRLRSEFFETESRLTGEITGLASKLTQRNGEFEDINAKEETFSQIKKELHCQLQQTMKECSEKDKIIVEMDEEQSLLKQKLVTSNEEIESLKILLEELRDESKQKEEQLAASKREVLDASTGEIERLKRRLEHQTKQAELKNERLAFSKKELDETLEKNFSVEIRLNSQNLELKSLKQEIEALNKILKDDKEKIASLKKSKNTIRKHTKQLGHEVISLREEKLKASNESERLVNSLKSELESLKSAAKKDRQTIELLTLHSNERSSLQTKLFESDRETDNLKMSCNQLCSVVEVLKLSLVNTSRRHLETTAQDMTELERISLSNRCISDIALEIQNLTLPLRNSEEDCEKSCLVRLREEFQDILEQNACLRIKLNRIAQRVVVLDSRVSKRRR